VRAVPFTRSLPSAGASITRTPIPTRSGPTSGRLALRANADIVRSVE
jgi:hypothetical protein